MAAAPYLGGMKGFFANVSPRRALKDLWLVLGAPTEFRFRSLVLAACVTGGIFVLMVRQEGRGLPRPPEVTYVESLAPGRTDAEIMAGNIAATRKVRAQEAQEERRAEDIRRMYKAVGAATGLDTQKMYDEGKAERAAEKQAEDARNKALLESLTAKPASGKPAGAQPAEAKP